MARSVCRSEETLITDRATDLLGGPLAESGFELVEVVLHNVHRRRVLRVTVHRPGGVSLDQVARASRLCSNVLDLNPDVVQGRYTLEVTSLGLDRPLLTPADYRRRVGETVRVERLDGTVVVGTLAACGDGSITLSSGGEEVILSTDEVARGRVEISFSDPNPRRQSGKRKAHGRRKRKQ
jgi:ribosome maturation factor RimP